ncbi:MAG: hydrolase, partial [Bacteroidales bacterium]|nr:hydrolase [Bacteroidales bacterium]
FVTASGVQFDARVSSSDKEEIDETWNAVWLSEIGFTSEGWVVEMKIPFSALRFSKDNEDSWGINFYRMVQRTREENTWSFVDNKLQGISNQLGILNGIKGIDPPVRLSLSPYAASYVNKLSSKRKPGYSVKGGMDLKYGISEGFTLDMMLIPDFGQVQSDDEILNLTPFETYYDEKRGFFTEGGELYNRAEIFYSRRIGAEPLFIDEMEEGLAINQTIVSNPRESQIVNASKVSGKTKKGTSIGLLNAMTAPTYATIRNTDTGKESHVLTQPFANYNVAVIDQSLKNNSFISLINTNMIMNGINYGANVTGSELNFNNKDNSYGIFAKGAFSQNQKYGESSKGGYYDIDLAKTKGKFQFTATQKLFTGNYDPNALGYNTKTNIFYNRLSFDYDIRDPFWRIMNWSNNIRADITHRLDGMIFSQFLVHASSFVTFRNYFTLGLAAQISPESKDFFEPRVDGRYYIRPGMGIVHSMLSSDYRKKLAIDFETTYANAPDYKQNYLEQGVGIRFRLNDRFMFIGESNNSWETNDRGYVSASVNEDSIYFGGRNVTTMENTFNFAYSFTNKASLSFRLRHYWSRLEYKDFYLLENNGNLQAAPGINSPDIGYNAFNIDMIYTWNFAPGSEFSIVWKNAIETDDDFIRNGYYDNFRRTLDSPQLNSFSVKFLYYLDYQSLKKKKGKV